MKTATKHTSPVNIEERQKADIRPGDTVRVWQKIKEGDKSRLQAFEGLVIARKHGKEGGATFTVRKVASGVGTEKIFPLYSPLIDKLEIIKRAKTRRAKLYYIRDKAAREIRKKMRQMRFEGQQDVIGAAPVVEEGADNQEQEGAQTEGALEEKNETPVEETPETGEKKEEAPEAEAPKEEEKKE
tara:strand:- start:112 stop:666 length:555 start_codon:yes stop_codon:yes gene_type:complete